MKAIIFDFNGTMVFDSPYHDQAWKRFSKKIRGSEITEEELARNVHGKVNEKIIEYLKPGVDKETSTTLSLEKEALYREMCKNDAEHYTLVAGLEEFLNTLKDKGIAMNIASASIKENIDFFVETFHLANWIDPSIIVYDDGSYENKIEMFKDAAKRMNVKIEDCIVFEDSFSGVQFAKEAGVKTIIAIPNQDHKEEFENNEAVAFTIKDFKDKRIWEVLA